MTTLQVGAREAQVSSSRGLRALSVLAVTLLLAVDITIVIASFVVAYNVRFVLSDAVGEAFPIDVYLRSAALIGTLAAFFLVLQGLGDLERQRSWPTRLRAISSAVSTGVVLAVVLSFDHDQRISRAWLAIGWTVSIASIAVWRTIAPIGYFAIRRRVVPRRRAVVVGANGVGQEVAREIAERVEVLGYVDNGTDVLDLDRPLLCAIAQLESLVRSSAVDEVVIALPSGRREQVDRIVARGFGREVDVKVIADLGEQLPRRLEVGRFGSRPYIGFAPVARVTWLKRGVDLVLAVFALVLSSIVFAAIAIAIKLDTAGPVFYRQRRVGKDGVDFEMIKFRSMRRDADQARGQLIALNEATGPLFKIRKDPRITRVGRILRRTSLDELPQLLNVLRGEMSLVGPRPPLRSEVELYEEWQLARLRARPGMTGLWQVSGRSEVPFNDMVRLDLHYVRNWSLGLDLEIMVRTIPAVIANRGAY